MRPSNWLLPLALLLAHSGGALAVDMLEDQSLTDIAGKDSVRIGPSTSPRSSSAPEAGDPIMSAKDKSASQRLDSIDNTLENARNQGTPQIETADAPNISNRNNLPEGQYAFPKSIDTKSRHNEAPQHYSPGTFQQTNVKIEGSVRLGR